MRAIALKHSTTKCIQPLRGCRGRRQLKCVAFKEKETPTDWRTQKMMDTAHVYYHDVWNKGDMAAIDRAIDPNIVFRDNIWGTHTSGNAPLVGVHKFKEHVEEQRTTYPDMLFQVDQYGLQDPHHLFVKWTCHETQLENLKGPASMHSSVITGVDILSFNTDRDKVIEVSQFRQPTYEEWKNHQPKDDHNPYEIKLARLHRDHHDSHDSHDQDTKASKK